MNEIIDVNTLFGPLPYASSDLPVEALTTLMQQNGVSRSLTLSTLGMLMDSTVGNAITKAACNELPHLLPVATLNPLSFIGDTQPITRLKADGFVMVRFFPDDQGWKVNSLSFLEIVRTLTALQMPLMIAASKPGDITSLLSALGDYPGSVVLAEVTVDAIAELLPALRRCPNWLVETSRLNSMGTLALISQTVGAERLLLGTTAPFRPISGAVQTVRSSGLDESQVALVLGGNAQRILRLQ